jgi:clan AA aspartic protease (TIGR02281 family)
VAVESQQVVEKIEKRSTRKRFSMKSVVNALVIVCLSLFLATVRVDAQVYQWWDEEGNVHFTDNDAFIPGKYRKRAVKRTLPNRRREKHEALRLPGGDGVPFDREGEFILVDGILNQELPVTFVLDTGATLSQITSEDARDLGVDVERLPTVGVWLADGSHTRVPVVTLSSIALGEAEVRGLRAVVTQSDVRLLGLNFLQHFRVTVDTRGAQLILERAGVLGPEKHDVTREDWVGNVTQPDTRVADAGEQLSAFPVILDSGSGGTTPRVDRNHAKKDMGGKAVETSPR